MKRVLGIILALSMVLSFGGCSYTPAEQTESPTGGEEQKERAYTYVNRHNEEFSYTITGEENTIYEKLPSELIQEWKDNVALAEKTYQQDKVIIVTEGYIRDINKNEFDNGAYYIALADDNDGLDILGMDEIAVYFRTDREYEDLLKYKTGDYITLICTVKSTSTFMEYPQLEAALVFPPDQAVKKESKMLSYLGKKVSDVTAEYGTDYIVDWMGGEYFYYATECPYDFFFYCEYALDNPSGDETITWVGSWEEGEETVGGISVGMSMDEFMKIVPKAQIHSGEYDEILGMPGTMFTLNENGKSYKMDVYFNNERTEVIYVMVSEAA